jgi:hypothetical protein
MHVVQSECARELQRNVLHHEANGWIGARLKRKETRVSSVVAMQHCYRLA